MKIIDSICHVIDTVVDWTGKIFSFLVLGILGVILCEVVLRRFFHKPQIWTQDSIVMIFACYIILICAYGFQKKAFVSVDVLFAKLPLMGQHILHIVTYFIYLIPFLFALLPKSWAFFWKAYTINERSYSVWAPPTWPVKLCLFVGILLLCVQTVSEILKQVNGIIGAATDKLPANNVEEANK